MSNKLLYHKAKSLIKEADILFFHHGRFPGIGWLIGKYTHSPYSHVGLAHWCGDKLYCIEFREFIGSRLYSVNDYINKGAKIDVFRTCQHIDYPIYDNGIESETKNFDNNRAAIVVRTAFKFIGLKYSYWTIWQILKTYIPFIRLRTKVIKNGSLTPKNFVCSTLVAYSYRVSFLDPVPFLSDEYTTPGDLARSSLFFKLFEIIGE